VSAGGISRAVPAQSAMHPRDALIARNHDLTARFCRKGVGLS
jgi:hypothetical protein